MSAPFITNLRALSVRGAGGFTFATGIARLKSNDDRLRSTVIVHAAFMRVASVDDNSALPTRRLGRAGSFPGAT